MSYQPMEIRKVSLETIKSISTLLGRSLRTAKLTVPTKDKTMCVSLVLYILKGAPEEDKRKPHAFRLYLSRLLAFSSRKTITREYTSS